MTIHTLQYNKTGVSFALLVIGSAMVLITLMLLHIGLGSVQLTIREAASALLNLTTNDLHRQVVWELRLPRALVALVAGAMLGLSGALLQTITRNPLAEPSLTGVSTGGVLFIVAWLSFTPTTGEMSRYLPLIALAGGLGSGLLIYGLNWRGRSDPLRLALIGVVVNAVLQSLTALLLIYSQQLLDGLLLWLIGSVNGRVWTHWHMLWPWALVALPLGLASASLANVLHLGDEVATGLGLRVELARMGLFALAALLAASAVSVVGAVGFIGLIGPHIARRLVGDDTRRVFILSALIAATILLAADLGARVVLLGMTPWLESSSTLPVGVVTALIGGPFFLYLVRRNVR
ncbi:MAG: iron ABC transporter permease [Chloroflexi bacterium AL-W]|nr:iron ABC transporter permease [Chloroflexi bacterium AL-N1]NOK71332.1 iron ABC transporter permease [Chloroflexi bacterium AL-N10]NOK78678.1 iron ABC transporter permease [Chloroflexi bacterium AL-N5]NOK85974.1 iron ABC transporter permease [Chloroflexi bacterium AL-W]NOK93057.1 iron ABC transporter permease [Chloroflexi bacterium AL-N15]